MPVLNRMHSLERTGQFKARERTYFYRAGTLAIRVFENAAVKRQAGGEVVEYQDPIIGVAFYFPNKGWEQVLALNPGEAESPEQAASIALRVTGVTT